MRRLSATVTLWAWATLSLIVPSAVEASFAGANDQPEKSIPQGDDPPNNGQRPPPSEDKEVIPPPPVGDEDIYTDAPNPHAGHEKEGNPPTSSACTRTRD